MVPKSNDKSKTIRCSQMALNDAWRKLTERCKFSLAIGVSEPNGLIWYMIAITIGVHISRAVGLTQWRHQPQQRWKKVHLASVVTAVSVYLHSFLHLLPMEEIISWRVLTCSLPKTWRVHPHTQSLCYNEGLGSGLPTSTALWHTIFSVSLPLLKFVLFSPYISLIRDIDPVLIEMEPSKRIW